MNNFIENQSNTRSHEDEFIQASRELQAKYQSRRRDTQVMNGFTEKELHCIARLLQGAIYGSHNVFDGCAFCKFNCQIRGNPNPNYEKILEKLTHATGVNLLPGSSMLFQSKFPHKRFLKNANENIKEYFKDYFKDI